MFIFACERFSSELFLSMWLRLFLHRRVSVFKAGVCMSESVW